MTTKDVHAGNKNTTSIVILEGVDSWSRGHTAIVLSSATAGYLVGSIGGARLGLVAADEVLSSPLVPFGERLTGPLGKIFDYLFKAQFAALGTVLGGPLGGLAGGLAGTVIWQALNWVPDSPPPTPTDAPSPPPTGEGPVDTGSDPNPNEPTDAGVPEGTNGPPDEGAGDGGNGERDPNEPRRDLPGVPQER